MEEWQKPETLILWVVIALSFLIFLLLIILLLVYKMFKKTIRTKKNEADLNLEYQQNLLNNSIRVQEKERKRIACDIHDALIGKLTVLQMSEFESSSFDLIKDCIDEARRISHDLNPPLLEYSSLEELIHELASSWQEVLPIMYIEDIRIKMDFSCDFKLQMIRIIQELMTNASKYSQAENIDLHIRLSSSFLCVLFSDNGKGFDMDTNVKGLGLSNLKTRTQYLNGFFRIKSEINKGTRTLFLFDLQKI